MAQIFSPFRFGLFWNLGVFWSLGPLWSSNFKIAQNEREKIFWPFWSLNACQVTWPYLSHSSFGPFWGIPRNKKTCNAPVSIPHLGSKQAKWAINNETLSLIFFNLITNTILMFFHLIAHLFQLLKIVLVTIQKTPKSAKTCQILTLPFYIYQFYAWAFHCPFYTSTHLLHFAIKTLVRIALFCPAWFVRRRPELGRDGRYLTLKLFRATSSSKFFSRSILSICSFARCLYPDLISTYAIPRLRSRTTTLHDN